MVKLSLLAVPALSLLAAYAVVEILRPAGKILRSRKTKKTAPVLKPAILLSAIIVILFSAYLLLALLSQLISHWPSTPQPFPVKT